MFLSLSVQARLDITLISRSRERNKRGKRDILLRLRLGGDSTT
jgi:hypothetical protein